jgi:hypothetical protein
MVASANSGSTNGVHHSCLLYGSGKSSILSRHSSTELSWAIQADAEPVNWNKSLDSFLAALISHQSGGTQFTTDDLLAVF